MYVHFLYYMYENYRLCMLPYVVMKYDVIYSAVMVHFLLRVQMVKNVTHSLTRYFITLNANSIFVHS